MSECSFRWAGHGSEEALPVVTLWGRRWTRPELLARVGRLEQVAGIRLVEGGDGAERGVRMLRCTTGAGFDFETWWRRRHDGRPGSGPTALLAAVERGGHHRRPDQARGR